MYFYAAKSVFLWKTVENKTCKCKLYRFSHISFDPLVGFRLSISYSTPFSRCLYKSENPSSEFPVVEEKCFGKIVFIKNLAYLLPFNWKIFHSIIVEFDIYRSIFQRFIINGGNYQRPSQAHLQFTLFFVQLHQKDTSILSKNYFSKNFTGQLVNSSLSSIKTKCSCRNSPFCQICFFK